MEITEIMKLGVYLLAAVVSAFIIPWLKGKIGAQDMDDFLTWVDIAVYAAEQVYESTDGDKKKTYVMDYLESKGFKVDGEDLDNAIEAAVIRLHNELYKK